jgi:hypothetical protein
MHSSLGSSYILFARCPRFGVHYKHFSKRLALWLLLRLRWSWLVQCVRRNQDEDRESHALESYVSAADRTCIGVGYRGAGESSLVRKIGVIGGGIRKAFEIQPAL